MSQTYSNVDSSLDPGGAIDWQERMAVWPAVAAYKQQSRQLLGDASPILDLGCGPGTDLLALDVEHAVGVDISHAMCRRAVERGATVVQSDAVDLPFRDASFGGARADRTFQHLSSPRLALQELIRVLQPGASLVIADPDQESLVIEVPGVARSVLDRLKALRRDVGYRNGRWISRLPAILESLRVEVTSVDAYPLILSEPADAFGLPTWPWMWRDEGRFTDDELAEWDLAIKDPGDGFVYCVTFLVVAGRRR